ncbi:hypothetical protein FB639_000182 [Coemansia asiatica]|nr:hypothetical protein FB639_000182 [Coemansia asiatica]
MPPEVSQHKRAQKINGIAGSQIEQPAALTMASIVVALLTINVLGSFLVRLGPQYMEPLYGNVLPQVNFKHGMMTSLAVGGFLGLGCWRRIRAAATGSSNSSSSSTLMADAKTGRALAVVFDCTALLTVASPLITAYVLSWSGYMGPIWGPTLTHCALSFPVFALLGFAFVVSTGRLFCSYASLLNQTATLFVYALAVVVPVFLVQKRPPFQRSCIGLLSMSVFAGIGSLVIKMITAYHEQVSSANAARASSNLRFVPTLAIVMVALASLLGHNRCSTDGVIDTKNSNYIMLFREESVTGWVITTDEQERNIRLLRSGHSIIGGHWKATNESIFGVFYYADAVRMVRGAPKSDERALQIGLGVGVSTRSLHQQGVAVDVVEIDPAVHRAAEQFFGLPRDLNAVYLQDAREYIETAPDATYNYVVHDVFTGGSVPSSLFSKEAIAHVRRIMQPSGVLAMNYVGVPNDERVMAHITSTLRTSFKYVRCFGEFDNRDSYSSKRSKEKQMGSMTNMMFFASNERMEIRIPKTKSAKTFNSIRETMLQSMLNNEITLDHLPKDTRPLTDRWNPLSQWQVGTAIDHWRTMRKLFPEEYWLQY